MDSVYHACIGELFEIQPINCCVLNAKIITSRCLRKRPGHSSVGVTVLEHWVPGTDAVPLQIPVYPIRVIQAPRARILYHHHWVYSFDVVVTGRYILTFPCFISNDRLRDRQVHRYQSWLPHGIPQGGLMAGIILWHWIHLIYRSILCKGNVADRPWVWDTSAETVERVSQ